MGPQQLSAIPGDGSPADIAKRLDVPEVCVSEVCVPEVCVPEVCVPEVCVPEVRVSRMISAAAA